MNLENTDAFLHTYYSDKYGSADYYAWSDGYARDECGYFVSLAEKTLTIKICERSDIFGVTVSSAAFIGNQADDARSATYALVVTKGCVDVRCETDVEVGDYVVSNAYGIAEKTNSTYGYKVIAKEDKFGVDYAVIALGVQADRTDLLGKAISLLDTRMGDAEINIAAAMNVANEAHNKAAENISSNEIMNDQLIDALDKVDDMANVVEDLDTQVGKVALIATQAQAISETAATSAESARIEAVAAANEALDKAGELEKTVEPINSWEYTDPVTGETNTGATYFAEYVKNGLSTKAEMETVERLDEENKLLITKNAENVQQILSSVDKYSVGEYSQAYGLTLQQARNILTNGMIYIPTPHGQADTHTEKYADGDTILEREFTHGFYYMWALLNDGEYMWSERIGRVWFGAEQPAGSAYTYWYGGAKLYLLDNEQWVQVATLAGNVNNRITSMIRQDVDSVTIEVTNARGSGTSLSERLSDTDATIASNAFWKNEDGSQYVATLQQKADGDGSSLALVAHRVDTSNGAEEDKSVELKGASIVLGQNGEDSRILVDADTIILNGETIVKDEEGGQTKINGAHIATGSISAEQIKVDDLKALNADIGGWGINDQGLAKTDDSTGVEIGLAAGNGGVYNTTDGEEENLGLVLYAGERAAHEIKAIAGTWRFNEDISISEGWDFDVEFHFSGWFYHQNSGWTKYENEPAQLSFSSSYVNEITPYGSYSGYELQVELNLLNVLNGKATLYKKEFEFNISENRYMLTSIDNIDNVLLNREITFGAMTKEVAGEEVKVIGIDDFKVSNSYSYISEDWFSELILKPNAEFLPGSIPLYSAMLDKEGRLYVEEARINGSMIDVDTYVARNIVLHDGSMIYGTGWNKTDGIYVGKNGVSVGKHLKVPSGTANGVSASGIIVGEAKAPSYFENGRVIAKTLEATMEVVCPTLNATTSVNTPTLSATTEVNTPKINATDVVATTTNSSNIRGNSLILSPDTNNTAYFQADANTEVYWNMLLSNSKLSSTAGQWQGIKLDCRTATLEKNDYLLVIGRAINSWKDAKFKVLADGSLVNPYITDGRFYNTLGDQNGRAFLNISNEVNSANDYVQFEGIWKNSSGNEVVSSDARAKHDIEILDRRYDVFFDNLLPQRFKYNVGTSDRYHTGYITRNVQEALATAEISEKEFAGIVTLNQGTEQEESALRYYEFVSLNTDQIQKLKKRVDALETKNAELEAKNAELEERLAKLEALLINNAE